MEAVAWGLQGARGSEFGVRVKEGVRRGIRPRRAPVTMLGREGGPEGEDGIRSWALSATGGWEAGGSAWRGGRQAVGGGQAVGGQEKGTRSRGRGRWAGQGEAGGAWDELRATKSGERAAAGRGCGWSCC